MKKKIIRVLSVVGARPNFMKIAPICEAFKKFNQKSRLIKFKNILVHTGQHYDKKMSDIFFTQLGLPRPDIYLGVGSGSHGEQTARVMEAFEKVAVKKKPDLILVVGDVNSTMAAAIVGAKLCIKVAHVEAGLRSGDRRMPEEINRLATDAISDILLTTSKDADVNLKREGVAKKKIFFVGNVMIDSLLKHVRKAESSKIKKKLGVSSEYALLTLHRPSNVDNRKIFEGILKGLEEVGKHVPIIFPAHPRTEARIRQFGLGARLLKNKRLLIVKPLGYLDFLHLMKYAKIILTDSGGIQEETTVLGVPCLTLRENTERPVTLWLGTNHLVGVDPAKITRTARSILSGRKIKWRRPPLWDGRAAERIVRVLARILAAGR